ncbi:MAG TPA: hypothetical protein VGA70_08205 [Longimicrobiales bacterium]|jgi:hypothetical protein
MSTIDLWIQWLRGPLFWAALAFLVLGLGRLVVLTLWGMVRTIRRAGDRTIPVGQVARATLRWILPVTRVGNRPWYSVTTVVFHASVLLVPVFLAGHVALWQRGLGVSWWALPNTVSDVLTLLALAAAVAIVAQRLWHDDARALGRAREYVLPLLIAVPFASGFLVMHPAWNPLPHDVAMLLHVLSADLLLFLIPMTKLSHMVLLPTTQLVSELAWHFPPDAGSKVAAALGKAGEPI